MPINAWKIIALKNPIFQLIGGGLRNMDGGLSLLILFVAFVSLCIKLGIFKSRHYEDIFSLAAIFLVVRFFVARVYSDKDFTRYRTDIAFYFICHGKQQVLVFPTVVLAALVHLSTLALLPAVLLACRFNLKTKICFFAFFALVASTLVMAFDVERFSRITPYLTG